MLTFISLKDAKDLKQEEYNGVLGCVCMGGQVLLGTSEELPSAGCRLEPVSHCIKQSCH